MRNDSHDCSNDPGAPAALRALRSIKVEPSPFLAKRVEANWAATARAPKSVWKTWLTSALAGAVVAALVGVVIVKNGTAPAASVSQYAVGQPYLIRMDIRAIPQSEVAYAEINLDGEGARFASKKFAEMNEQRKIVISGDRLIDKQYLPVVVEGVKQGAAKVTVSFYNAKNELLATKSLDLNFHGGAI